ncbi:hypothetical protein [Microcoleus vaginatus]|uniref:hypothetical protein n=1 Tax=Microcoleus vaginatus TaxID=119532 RepID=UPI0032A45E1C
MFLKQGTSQPQASQEEKVKGDIDMAWACGEFVELDDVQQATVVGGRGQGGSVYVDGANLTFTGEVKKKGRVSEGVINILGRTTRARGEGGAAYLYR